MWQKTLRITTESCLWSGSKQNSYSVTRPALHRQFLCIELFCISQKSSNSVLLFSDVVHNLSVPVFVWWSFPPQCASNMMRASDHTDAVCVICLSFTLVCSDKSWERLQFTPDFLQCIYVLLLCCYWICFQVNVFFTITTIHLKLYKHWDSCRFHSF